jgi:hypothetical protein
VINLALLHMARFNRDRQNRNYLGGVIVAYSDNHREHLWRRSAGSFLRTCCSGHTMHTTTP